MKKRVGYRIQDGRDDKPCPRSEAPRPSAEALLPAFATLSRYCLEQKDAETCKPGDDAGRSQPVSGYNSLDLVSGAVLERGRRGRGQPKGGAWPTAA
jgi:hypothetical protein